MTALTLAAAQSISIAGDVPANIQQHLLLMRFERSCTLLFWVLV
jgi:hypothetical protein